MSLPGDLIERAAANIAAWHDSNARALGLTTRNDGLLWTLETSGPFIYHSAITLRQDRGSETLRRLDALLARRGPGALGVGDSWGRLNLAMRGFGVHDRPAWYLREAAPADQPVAGGLEIREIGSPDELLAFETASIDGFESPTLRRYGPAGVHAPGILADPNMHVYVGLVEGAVVSGAMAYVAAGLTGIYSVSTLPAYRHRGYGTALTRSAINAAPHLPAMLQPSPIGASMYRSLGFVEVGQSTTWVREPLAASSVE